ncbi:MAG: S49 family peptidase [Pseudomonadota bacterium]|nr:S49 family peptidase [Pseudomonadota bacterium]
MFQKSSSNESGPGSPPTKQEWQILEKVATASVTEQRKARRWGIFFKLLTFFYLFVIIASLLPKESSLGPVYDEHVALVSLDGVIAADAPANANTVVAGLRDAFADDSSKAVILSINSPGGSPVQSGYINDEIYRLKALYPEKKMYAVIADLGASGGYYVASAADEIYADKASLVGSIGVISAGFGFEKLIEKMGVERRIYSAGESKAFLDSFSAEKERDVTFWQSVLAETHAQFIEVVKTGRGERLINDPAIFSGLIWTGEGALAKGLIDGLGSAGYVAREVIGIEDVIDYTVEPNPFEEFAKRIGTYFALGVRSMMAPQLR